MRYSVRDYETAIDLLKYYAKNSENFCLQEAEKDALIRAAFIIEREKEWIADQEAHSEATLELEAGREIPLVEWARLNNVDPANARQRAARGTIPAYKVGSTWMINEFAENKVKRNK